MKEYEDEFISMEHILRAMDIDQTTQQFIGNKAEVIKEIITKVRGKSCDNSKSRSKLRSFRKIWS